MEEKKFKYRLEFDILYPFCCYLKTYEGNNYRKLLRDLHKYARGYGAETMEFKLIRNADDFLICAGEMVGVGKTFYGKHLKYRTRLVYSGD